MPNTPRRVIKFRGSAYCGDGTTPVNQLPVKKINERQQPHPTVGGTQNTFTFAIEPWDLQRLLIRANQLGLQGKTVTGFDFDSANENIYVAAKPEAPPAT